MGFIKFIKSFFTIKEINFSKYKKNHSAKYINSNVPKLKNVKSLCLFLRCSPNFIYPVSNNPQRFYQNIFLLKKDGTRRTISEPELELKAIQKKY